jgi:hypothetical protein
MHVTERRRIAMQIINDALEGSATDEDDYGDMDPTTTTISAATMTGIPSAGGTVFGFGQPLPPSLFTAEPNTVSPFFIPELQQQQGQQSQDQLDQQYPQQGYDEDYQQGYQEHQQQLQQQQQVSPDQVFDDEFSVVLPRRSVSESAIAELRKHESMNNLDHSNSSNNMNTSMNVSTGTNSNLGIAMNPGNSSCSHLGHHNGSNSLIVNAHHRVNHNATNTFEPINNNNGLISTLSAHSLSQFGGGQQIASTSLTNTVRSSQRSLITDDNEDDEEFKLINKLGIDNYMSLMANLEEELKQEQYNIYFDETEWIQFEDNLQDEDYYSSNYNTNENSQMSVMSPSYMDTNSNNGFSNNTGDGCDIIVNESNYLNASESDAACDGFNDSGFIVSVVCPQCRYVSYFIYMSIVLYYQLLFMVDCVGSAIYS